MARTRILRIDPEKFAPDDLAPAAEALREGGLVAIPTETVYGIAVNLEKPEAVRRLLDVRRSPEDKRITVHIGGRDGLRQAVPGAIPAAARRLIRRFWPGPLTIVFPAPDGRGVGVRHPDHKVACGLILRAGVRVGAPSANLSGEAPAVTGEEVVRRFDGKVDVIVDSGPTRHKGVSTVVRVEGARVEVLREGAIPRAAIEDAGAETILFVCTGNVCRSPMAAAIFRRMLADRRGVKEEALEGTRILSAGTAAGGGLFPPEGAERAAKEYGAGLSSHESRPLTASMVEEADRVFVMTEQHRESIAKWMPEHAEKVELLDPEGGEIGDPFGDSEEAYRATAKRIHECLEKRIREIA